MPVSYLAGFTPSGSREEFLYVKDLESERTWKARPRCVSESAFTQVRWWQDASDLTLAWNMESSETP